MYPYYEKDLKEGSITREYAQELIDCIWVKLNDLNKCRDAASAEGFAGYSLFQNLIVGGQTVQGRDATNDLSFMCITASEHVFLPMKAFQEMIQKIHHYTVRLVVNGMKTGYTMLWYTRFFI